MNFVPMFCTLCIEDKTQFEVDTAFLFKPTDLYSFWHMSLFKQVMCESNNSFIGKARQHRCTGFSLFGVCGPGFPCPLQSPPGHRTGRASRDCPRAYWIVSCSPYVTGCAHLVLAVNRGRWEYRRRSPTLACGRLRPRLPLFGRAGSGVGSLGGGGGAVRVSGARGDGDVRPAPLLPADAEDPRSSWPRRRSVPRPTRAASAARRPWPTAPAACWRAWTSWSSGEGGGGARGRGRAPGGLPSPRPGRRASE